MAWFVQLLVGLFFQVVAYIIQPKPKSEQPDITKQLDKPTAGSGVPIPVVFGSIRVTEPNIIYYGDDSVQLHTIRTGKK